MKILKTMSRYLYSDTNKFHVNFSIKKKKKQGLHTTVFTSISKGVKHEGMRYYVKSNLIIYLFSNGNEQLNNWIYYIQ